MQTFSELPISQYMKDRLAAAQFVTPTPVQKVVIPHGLQGSDVVATAQTGTGKTLAYLVPMIEAILKSQAPGIAALVLVPTRELAMQVLAQYDALRGKQLVPATLVIGGVAEQKQLTSLRKLTRVVVATPGRLEDFLDRKLINLRTVRILVLDEADRMLDMGFVPAIRRIASTLPKERQTMCFSATMEASVAHLVHDYTKKPVRLSFGLTLKPPDSVRLQAFEVLPLKKQDLLRGLLGNETGRCLVFTRTKRGADRLSWDLTRDGFSTATIHGDLSQSQRTAALTGFQKGRFRILIATDVASRGIHVEDIAHVINYDLPELAEDFIHRVGRTGRAGNSGVASILIGREERNDLLKLERTLGIKIERMQSGNTPAAVPPRQRKHMAPSGKFAVEPLLGEFLQSQLET